MDSLSTPQEPRSGSTRKGTSRQPRRSARVRHQHSAGGIVYRRRPGSGSDGPEEDVEIALIATGKGTRWQLPKGRVRPGESSVQAAVREIREETGLEAEVEAYLTTLQIEYWNTYRRRFPEKVVKDVDIYLMRAVGGALNDSSTEVDGVAWCTPTEALERLTFDSERACVRLAMERWR